MEQRRRPARTMPASSGLPLRSLPLALPPIHSEKSEGRMSRASRWLVRFQKGILEGGTEGDDGREERRVGVVGELEGREGVAQPARLVTAAPSWLSTCLTHLPHPLLHSLVAPPCIVG